MKARKEEKVDSDQLELEVPLSVEETIKKLRSAGLLSEQNPNLGFVSTGVYALNKIISGSYTGGIPIGRITQFIGESSTAKTVFVTSILKEAQKEGYYTILIDSENAFSSDFAQVMGLDPTRLIYLNPETVEECFDKIHKLISEIRLKDPNTPIVIGYDSLAVSPTKEEINAENFDQHNMVGAMRAKIIGACLRKINPMLMANKVALIIVNQIRSKVGIIYGSPDTMAAGGKSLEYYLGVNLKTISNKTSDLLRDDRENVLGIKGRVVNTKNKVTTPFQECDFELFYNKGLSPYCGLIKLLQKEGLAVKNAAWYTYNGKKFQESDFEKLIEDKSVSEFNNLRIMLGLN